MTHPSEPRASGAEDTRSTVLFVVLASGLGGSTRSVATVLAHLDPARIRRVLATPPRGRFIDLVNDRGLAEDLVPLPVPDPSRSRAVSRFRATWRVGSWLRAHRSVTAVHVNGALELNVVAPAARLFGVPVVVWSHSRVVSPWMKRLGWMWPRILPKITFAAVSPFAARVLADAGLAEIPEIAIVANPIDPDDVVGAPDGHDGLVIGYLGSDAAYKGFDLLPPIAAALDDLPITFLVFSNQNVRSNPEPWERLAEFSSDRVRVVGKVNDVREAYARCDIILCPSLQESFCRVAAEAMLNGLPVVASDLEPIRLLLGEEEAGLLFSAGDVRGAADALRRLVIDARLRAALGMRGRERAKTFSPAVVVRELSALYHVSDGLVPPPSPDDDGVPVSRKQR